MGDAALFNSMSQFFSVRSLHCRRISVVPSVALLV